MRKILVPLDGSTTGEAIFPHLSRLVRSIDANVRILHVCPDKPSATKVGWAYLHSAKDRFGSRLPFVDAAIRSGKASEAIIRHAVEEEFDLIALTTHGRSGIGRLFYGSTAEELLRTSPVPLFLVRPATVAAPLRRVLVPLDGSTRSESILPLVGEFAKGSDSHVILLTVAPQEQLDVWGVKRLETALARLEDAGLSAEIVVRHGEVVEDILKVGELRSVDAIALSTHGRTGLDRFNFGSVAEALLHRSKVPVLVHRTASVLENHKDLFPQQANRL